MPTIAVLHRRRVHPLPDATATKLAGNAWEVVVPKAGAIVKILGRPLVFEAVDDLVLLIDDVEPSQVLGSGETTSTVTATVLL